MVHSKLTTTYRREFSPERSMERPSMTSLIRSNFDYALYRRHLENSHEQAPFVWDAWQYADDTDLALPIKKLAGNKPKLKKSARQDIAMDKNGGKGLGAETRDAGSQTLLWNSTNEKRQEDKNGRQLPAVTHDRQMSRAPSATEKKKEYPYVRKWVEVTSPPRRPQSAPPVVARQQQQALNMSSNPFAQYGTGDAELETGNKRTYNVKADDEIYKSALRAKKRQEAQVHGHLTAERRQVYSERRKRALFNDDFDLAMNKETAQWTSEYRRNFRGHDC